jgi:hypothetical protein
MINGKEENEVRFRDRLGLVISCPSHRAEDNGTFWKVLSYPFQKRDGTEDLSNGCGMDPNWLYKGEAREEPYSLDAFLSKSFLEKAPEEKVGGREDEKATEENIVKLVNHRIQTSLSPVRLGSRRSLLPLGERERVRGIKIVVCSFGQLIEAFFQKSSPFFEMSPIPIGVNNNGFSPNEDSL